MRDAFLRFSASVALCLVTSAPYSQSRCDCDVIVDQCRAEIRQVATQSRGAQFHIKTDTEQCAIVEYTIDGANGQTTVWDYGEEIDNVSARKPGGKLAVRSCRVCKDRLAANGQRSNEGACKAFDQPDVTEAAIRRDLKAMNLSLDDLIANKAASLNKGFTPDNNGPLKDYPSAQRELWEKGQERERRLLALMRCVKENP